MLKTARSITSNPSTTKDAQEYFLCSHFKLKDDPEKQIIFVETMIGDQAEYKLMQLNKFIMKKLDKYPNLPIVVAGNFNQ